MKRILQYLAIAATSLVIISCGNNKTAETEADHQEDTAHEGESAVVALTQQQYNTVGIILGNVESKQISGTFKASGVLDVPPQQGGGSDDEATVPEDVRQRRQLSRRRGK